MSVSSYEYLTPSGVIVADTSDTLSEVQTEWQNAFGADLIVTPDTPQGVMISAEALARNNVINNNAAVANQINPNIAGGVFLDAIGLLTGIQRNAQTPTVVTGVTIAGVAGTVIPVNSQASTAAGDLFELTQSVTIPSGGSTTGNFQSVANGPIPCAADALNIITSAVIGWETVNNTNAGVLGQSTQSDQAFRAFRLNTLAFQGLSLAEAITSALYATTGVTSLSFRENYYSVPMGMLISITGGTTLAGQIWGMTTTAGTGSNGSIIVDTDAMNFAKSLQDLPTINPWPIAAFSTTANITLSGLGTQGGGDWASGLSAGNIILVKNQTTASQNGLWLAESGAWTRQAYNPSTETILPSNSGISMVANSVYACVAGGTTTAVAAALLENKSSACAWNGNITQNVVEPASGQTYPVQFDTPTQVGILVDATVSGVSAQAATQAILDYFAGNIVGFAGAVVGGNISPFEIAGAIMSENPGAYISSVTISLSSGSPSFSSNPIPIGLNEQAYTTSGYITISVG